MQACDLIIKDNITFSNYKDALHHISSTLAALGIVKTSHDAALLKREEMFPTGIALADYAVAIPHCEAEHAIKPAIYIIKPLTPVTFHRPDEDGTVDVSLIIALVVTSPADQLELLRALFSNLQNYTFYQTIISSSPDEIKQLFQQKIFHQA